MSEQRVEVTELAAQPVLSIRETIPVARLGDTMGERIGVLSRFLRERGTPPAGPPYVRYHTFTDTETDMEFGVPVKEPTTGDGSISSGHLPAGPAVTTWHLSAHDRLGEAYARLDAWRTENGREPAGPAWEVYHWIDLAATAEPGPPPDPSTWRMQLVQPIN
jgi:effector-binding domain-containing protein